MLSDAVAKMDLQEHATYYCVTGMVTSFVVLYFTNRTFHFHCKVFLFNTYYITAALAMLPFMMLNGRSRKNMLWCKSSQLLSGKIFGLKSRVLNEDNLISDGPSVIVCNHQSALDLAGMGKLFSERSTVLAKKELLYVGPFGLGLWLSGFIFIERSKRKESKVIMDKVADEINKDGLCVFVFPEGTRSMKEEMLPFKRGAFNLAVKAQVPVVPVVISSYKKFFNPANHVFNSGNYVIEVMSPISTVGLTVDDVPKLTDDVRSKMMEKFQQISSIDHDKDFN